MANDFFYPEIKPFDHGLMEVQSPHVLYWEQCGNPNGEPVLFLHGGPGAGCSEHDRRFFDPEHYRMILFDQRGCGRSTPVGELSNNSMDDTCQDIEQLREQLGIDRWHVFGGSYGSTISLYYSQSFPDRCKTLVIRGIWLLREQEINWWLYQVSKIQPETWRTFAEFIPASERDDLLEAYWKRLTGPDEELARQAAEHWAMYEILCCTLVPNEEFANHFKDPDVAWAVARLEAHYFRNVRPDPDSLLLDQVTRIRDIPAFAVHGRYDVICPIKSMFDLIDVWPELDYEVAPRSGHSSHEPEITRELVAAMDRIRDTGSPVRVGLDRD